MIDQVFERRGELAFALVALLIVVLWVALDQPAAEQAETSTAPTTTVTSTTTSTVPVDADEVICDLSGDYVEAASEIPSDDTYGPLSELSLAYWQELLPLVDATLRIEIVAVVDHYDELIEVAKPLDYDSLTIISDGNRERFEQLITRPANGLEIAEAFVAELCEVELPEQPVLTSSEFRSLERQADN